MTGPVEESDPFFKFQRFSGFGVCHVCGAHIFARQPSPSTLACADSKDMFDWQHSGAEGHHHENLLGLELANDDATVIIYSFFQVFQQRRSMRRVLSDDSVF
jgi:hypothetical protein